MREHFPTIAQVEPAVKHGQLPVDTDPLQRRGRLVAQVALDQRRVADRLDVVQRVVQRMVGRKVFQVLVGQHATQFATESRVESQSAAAGIGKQQPPRLQVAPQPLDLRVLETEIVMAGHVQQRMTERLPVGQPHVLPLELHVHGAALAGGLQQVVNG